MHKKNKSNETVLFFFCRIPCISCQFEGQSHKECNKGEWYSKYLKVTRKYEENIPKNYEKLKKYGLVYKGELSGVVIKSC